MTSNGLAELRGAWLVLAPVLGIAIQPASSLFITLAAVPWLLGAAALFGPRSGAATQAVAELVSSRGGRWALTAIAFMLALVQFAFGPLGMLLLATGLAALVLAAGAVRGGEASVSVTGVCAILLVTLAICTAFAEMVLRQRRFEDAVGSWGARRRMDSAYDSLWTRNVFGFRSRHETMRRNPGTRRLLALGDSFTWGDKIADADSAWPAQLERRLGREQPTEVINMGQRGWTTGNEAEQLRRVGWQFDPDVVLVQYFVNDPYESGPNFARGGEHDSRLLPARLRDGWAGKWALTNLLESTYNQWLRGPSVRDMFSPLYVNEQKGWQQTAQAFREIADSARARGVPVVVILYPAFLAGEWTAETYPLAALYRQAANAASAAGLTVLDLTPVFVERGGNWRRWWALPWDSHPNAEAHGITADAIAAFLREHGLLAPRKATRP